LETKAFIGDTDLALQHSGWWQAGRAHGKLCKRLLPAQ